MKFHFVFLVLSWIFLLDVAIARPFYIYPNTTYPITTNPFNGTHFNGTLFHNVTSPSGTPVNGTHFTGPNFNNSTHRGANSSEVVTSGPEKRAEIPMWVYFVGPFVGLALLYCICYFFYRLYDTCITRNISDEEQGRGN